MNTLEKFKSDLASVNSVEEMRDLFSIVIKQLGYHGFDAFTVKIGTADNADQECNIFICDYGLDLRSIGRGRS